MAEIIKQGVSIERSKAAELAKIKEALIVFQETALTIQDPDNLTSVEQERLAVAGDRLIIDHEWPLARVLDLYYGMRPDATKPIDCSTDAIAGIMVAADEGNKFNYWQKEDAEYGGEAPTDPYVMLFGQRRYVDAGKLLPDSYKRSPLPYII
jgi:hypothetical protein